MDEKINIFLTEDVPSGNKGEAAILFGIRKILDNKYSNINFSVYSSHYEDDIKWYSSISKLVTSNKYYFKLSDKKNLVKQLFSFLLLFFLGAYKRFFGSTLIINRISDEVLLAYLDADILLFGHDNCMGGKNLSIIHVLISIYAKIANKKLVILGGSFGPFSTSISNVLGKFTLRNTDIIILRDIASQKYIKEKYKITSIVTADPAWLLPPDNEFDYQNFLKLSKIPESLPLIGITTAHKSMVIDNFGLYNKLPTISSVEFHNRLIAEIIAYINTELQAGVVFLPHCIENYQTVINDDRIPSRAIYNQVKEHNKAWIIEDDLSASVLKSIMRNFDLLIGERTHSMIGALSVYTPVLALSYPNDFRTYSIIGNMVGLDNNLYDVRMASKDSLCKKISDIWAVRRQQKEYLINTIPNILLTALSSGLYIDN